MGKGAIPFYVTRVEGLFTFFPMSPPSYPARITKESIASYCLNKCTENYVHLIQISLICISALPIRHNNTFIFANAVRNGKNQKLARQ